MNRTYCISDLHGHHKVFMSMLEKIEFDPSDKLYVLGDCNDRGAFAYEIYDYLEKHRENIFLLKGNHEVMMRDTLVNGDWDSPNGRLWKQNGGKRTVEQFMKHFNIDGEYSEESQKKFEEYCRHLVEMINALPEYIELTVNGKDFVLIHAGINPEKTLYEQTEEECVWMRDWFFLNKGLEGKTIIFGHTPTVNIDSRTKYGIWNDPVYKDKIGIDGGLANYEEGQLNCLCLDDLSVVSIKRKEVEEG
ncbi:MAG: metallophosphoesterase [Solobacterium sp.]|nr:metallophosphoesterase [Solobacterium sp.]